MYFNKIHTFELKCPNGSNETVQLYYLKELDSLTYFFDRNLDFYQYYRSNSTHLDELYFTRHKQSKNLCKDSAFYVMDADYSTVYDYKIAKIICNEMLRIYLNKKLNSIEKQIGITKSRSSQPLPDLKWTGAKVALVEFGNGLEAVGFINHGNANIKDIICRSSVDTEMKANSEKLIEKKRELKEAEDKLFSLEEKWINSEVTKETYDRWYLSSQRLQFERSNRTVE